MPFVRVETNHEFSKEIIERVMAQITEVIHIKKGDPTEVISVVAHTNLNISFGGESEKPAAIVQLFNLKMPADITTELTESISDILLKNFNVSAQRMYIFFQEFTEMHLVGWNRKTFADKTIMADIDALLKGSQKT